MNIKIKNSLLFLFFHALFLTACEGEDAEPINQRKFGGTLSFNVNGEVVSLSDNSITVSNGVFDLESVVKDRTVLNIGISKGIDEYRYPLNGLEDPYFLGWPASVIYRDASDVAYFSNSLEDYPVVGEVEITEIDEEAETMSGTFNAILSSKAGESLTITNGSFTDVPYLVYDDGAGNVYLGKVDGKDFFGKLLSNGLGNEVAYFSFVGDRFKTLSFDALPVDITPGVEYNISDLYDDSRFTMRYVDGLQSYRPVTGTLILSKNGSDVLEGSFDIQFESYPIPGKSVTITDGSFAVNFNR